MTDKKESAPKTVRVLATRPRQRVSFPVGYTAIADEHATFIIPEELFKQIEHLDGYKKINKNWTPPVKEKSVRRVTTNVSRPSKNVFIPESSKDAAKLRKESLKDVIAPQAITPEMLLEKAKKAQETTEDAIVKNDK